MSVWASLGDIPGYEYPGSHLVPETVDLIREDDAVDVAVIRIDEGTPEEVTSRYTRISVGAESVLLDEVGRRALIGQLLELLVLNDLETAVFDAVRVPPPPDLPDGTGPDTRHINLDWVAAALPELGPEQGSVTWADRFLGAVCPVFAVNQDQLRAELIQVTAVAVQWIDAIDHRSRA